MGQALIVPSTWTPPVQGPFKEKAAIRVVFDV
jgi:hypothetical protein